MKRQLELLVLAGLLLYLGNNQASAQTVTKEIKLFNGKDLTNFYTYLGSPEKGEKGTARTKIRKRSSRWPTA